MVFKKVGMIGVLVVLVAFFVSSLASAEIAEEPVKDIRVVYVKVAADQDFREFYGANWQNQIEDLIEKVSQVFEREFGIIFVVGGFEEWDSEIHKDIFGFVEELRKEVKLETNDLVIGFTGKGNQGKSGACVRRLLGNYLVLEDYKAAVQWWQKYYEIHKESYEERGWGEKQYEKFIEKFIEFSEKVNMAWNLTSQLGKIFGALKFCDKQNPSVMNDYFPFEDRISLVFDQGNKKIISGNKDIDFKQLAWRRNQAEKELELVERCKLKIRTMELSYEEELKIWLEIVDHLDKAAEYVEIPTLGDLSDAAGAREKALGILKALGLEEEFKRESLALAEVYVKTARVYKRMYQIEEQGERHIISLENIALSYYAATNWFTEAGENRNAVEYGVKAAEFYEKAGNSPFAKKLYEWAAQMFEFLGEKEKAKEAREKAELVGIKLQANKA